GRGGETATGGASCFRATLTTDGPGASRGAGCPCTTGHCRCCSASSLISRRSGSSRFRLSRRRPPRPAEETPSDADDRVGVPARRGERGGSELAATSLLPATPSPPHPPRPPTPPPPPPPPP